uniref:Uncharacterized protein n=1 Tax=Streptomyces sp. NBC_00049 TaxID=2903617 RepID=A0AAU2JWE1_9ACTN
MTGARAPGARRPDASFLVRVSPIFAAAVLPALPAGAFLVVKAVHLPATRRPGLSRGAVGAWAEAAGACPSVAVIAFAAGGLSSFDSRPTRPCLAECAERFGPETHRTPDADMAITSRTFPVSTVCAFPDGTRVELVPGWINPLIVGSPAGAAGCVAMAVQAGTSSHRPRSPRPAGRAA